MLNDRKDNLPSFTQTWAHSVCDFDSLSKALEDSTITAIESDIVIGICNGDGEEGSLQIRPIMAHPPSQTSDLSFQKFLRMATFESKVGRKLKKHLKLDFKEIEAVEPVLRDVKDMEICHCPGKTVFLNADIFPGPGHRGKPPTIESEVFLQRCVNALGESHTHFAYSLGWRQDCRSVSGFSNGEVEDMKNFILKHDLLHISRGVVLSVNARVLAKNCGVFDSILLDLPEVQLLVWTATGEPPISGKQINFIKSHFKNTGCIEKVGFDCKVASSSLMGLLYDYGVRIAGMFYYAF